MKASVLQTIVDLRIPGFGTAVPPGSVLQRVLQPCNTDDWYNTFAENACRRICRGYFPIFRFSDGECYFVSGYARPPRRPSDSLLRYWLIRPLSTYVKYRMHKEFWSGVPGYGHEHYDAREWTTLRPAFAANLRQIASTGLIAFNYVVESSIPLCDQYLDSVGDWLEAEGIVITPDNYVPFYFVYALLLGPDAPRLFADHHVLVITNHDAAKAQRIGTSLVGLGAAGAEFINISRSKAMLEVVDLSAARTKPDIVLVGGGVGAANILSQLQSTDTLCIDAGYVLDVWNDPSRRGTRVFTRPD